MVEPMQVD